MSARPASTEELAADVRDGIWSSEPNKADAALDALVARVAGLEAQLADATEHLGDLVAFGESTARARAAEAQVAALTQDVDDLREECDEKLRRARAAEAALANTRQALTALIAWNEKYPSHRIYGSEDIKRIAAEMDAISEQARRALSGGAE